MRDIDAKRREAGLYPEGSHSAYVAADAYRKGTEGVTECICSGDPVYLVLIGTNILLEASRRLSLPEEKMEHLVRKIREELEKSG